jgi:hypothetical protein
VAQLVHHNAELVAVLADGDGLHAVAALAHERAAAVDKQRQPSNGQYFNTSSLVSL